MGLNPSFYLTNLNTQFPIPTRIRSSFPCHFGPAKTFPDMLPPINPTHEVKATFLRHSVLKPKTSLKLLLLKDDHLSTRGLQALHFSLIKVLSCIFRHDFHTRVVLKPPVVFGTLNSNFKVLSISSLFFQLNFKLNIFDTKKQGIVPLFC